eukprot:COSAG01_NODE_28657_length_656_cov_0.721724_1_plen_25_part_10
MNEQVTLVAGYSLAPALAEAGQPDS